MLEEKSVSLFWTSSNRDEKQDENKIKSSDLKSSQSQRTFGYIQGNGTQVFLAHIATKKREINRWRYLLCSPYRHMAWSKWKSALFVSSGKRSIMIIETFAISSLLDRAKGLQHETMKGHNARLKKNADKLVSPDKRSNSIIEEIGISSFLDGGNNYMISQFWGAPSDKWRTMHHLISRKPHKEEKNACTVVIALAEDLETRSGDAESAPCTHTCTEEGLWWHN